MVLLMTIFVFPGYLIENAIHGFILWQTYFHVTKATQLIKITLTRSYRLIIATFPQCSAANNKHWSMRCDFSFSLRSSRYQIELTINCVSWLMGILIIYQCRLLFYYPWLNLWNLDTMSREFSVIHDCPKLGSFDLTDAFS